MATYAVLDEENNVTNTIEYNDDVADHLKGVKIIRWDGLVSIGWKWNGKEMFNPNPIVEEAKPVFDNAKGSPRVVA